MRLRRLGVLVGTLLLLSTVLGLSSLAYLRIWGVPRFLQDPTRTAERVTGMPTDSTIAPTATTEVPRLVTPTFTPTSLPTATPSPTPSPTPTFTPTPTSTPTPLPGVRLSDAHRHKRNGNYPQAMAEFRAVLADPDDEAQSAEALYEVGVCAFLDASYAQALELLNQFLQEYPADHRQAAAHFYLAETLVALGEYEPAIDHYRDYLDRQDVLADLVYTRIGDSDMALQEYALAIQVYEAALERTTDPGQQYDLEEQIGLAYSAWGRYDEAATWLLKITGQSQNVHRLARIWYLIGQVYRMSGQEDMAVQAFSQAAGGDPRPGYAFAALVALLEADVPVDEYQRGLINYHAANYASAVAAFRRYIETTPEYNSDAHYYIALSYFESGSYDLAVQECEYVQNAYAGSIPHWGEIWLLKAEALSSQGEQEAAVETYLDFVANHPDHPLAAGARWEAAQLLEHAGDLKQAGEVYTALADNHVNAAQAPAARFRAGLCRYRSDDIEAAKLAWQELISGYPAAAESLQARYWLAKVLWAQGHTGEARRMLQDLAADEPRSYYGLRAAHLLAYNGQAVAWPTRPPTVHQTSDEDAERQEAAAWLRSWTDLPHKADLATVSSGIAKDILFRRSVELMSLGMEDLAVQEFDALRREKSQDPAFLYQLSLTARDLGLYPLSLRAAIDLIGLAPEPSVLEMPHLVQRLAFPLYFPDLVVEESMAYNIDPLLMFSLIRQESVFGDTAVSWAGAVGLAQVMPSTGEWIAEMMPWPQYSADLLKRAYVNVKFGTWFLDRILEQTDGNVAAALVGYNGGPRNAMTWLEEAGGDPDLFVEVITRDEPQHYVREIYRHYTMYVHLYGAG